MKQKDLAAAVGIDVRLLSNFEVGVSYPATKYIVRLNELGANIHPSVFSHFTQKLTKAIRKRLVVLKRTDTKHLEGVLISKQTRIWIQEQMLEKGIYHSDVAKKARCSRTNVGNAIRGRIKSQKVQRAIAELLGYESFEKLIAASRGKGAV
jgi:ribosome-binding protein aMBF1 (putative translation factor)